MANNIWGSPGAMPATTMQFTSNAIPTAPVTSANAVGVGANGAIVLWHTAGRVDLDAIKAGFTNIGLEDFAPKYPTANAALKDAMQETLMVSSRYQLRPLKDDGFVLEREERGELVNAHVELVSAIVQKDDSVAVTAHCDEGTNLMQTYVGKFNQAFGVAKTSIRALYLTEPLNEVVRHLGGIPLRPRGGAYWLPDTSLQLWAQITGIVQNAVVEGVVRLYTVHTMFSPDTIRTISDSLANDVTDCVGRIDAEIDGGKLAEKALTNRVTEAKSIRARIEEYEKILATTLPTLRDQVDKLEESAASAALMAAAARKQGASS